jgi:L-aminopeptidase/D-esterase-like protein
VAKVGGLEHGWRGGQGLAVVEAAGVTVGALVANNAVGEVIDDDGTWIARARIPDDAAPLPHARAGARRRWRGRPTRRGRRWRDPHGGRTGPTANTVIGCVVTDAALTKRQAHRVADLAHSGMARALRPVHTDRDGDALFCLATGRVPATSTTLDLVAHLAVEAVAAATRRGPRAAVGGGGLPGLAET